MRHMLLREWVAKFSRRGFLRASAATVAAAAVSGPGMLAGTAEPPFIFDSSPALIRLTRDLFPHDHLDDAFYARAIVPLRNEESTDPATQKLIFLGIGQLNIATRASTGKNYTDVTDESVRIAAIKTIEGSEFFTKVYTSTMTPLYNQPELWTRFGYEGPSSALGGYVNRGFSDMDWL